jgi:hypothetical protein
MKSSSLFRFFSSLKLAVISILLLAGVLAWATFVEADHGMRAAHLTVYGTPWFGGVLFLLGANVFCAAMSRYPWKKHQTGFVITHAGILLLLFGSVMTQRWGVDGNLPVEESKSNNEVHLNNLVLAIYNEAGVLQAEVPVPETGRSSQGKLLEIDLGNEDRLVVDEFLPRVIAQKNVVPSPLSGVGMPAAKLDLISSRFNVSQWLLATSPTKPEELNLGPAVLSLRRLWTPQEDSAFLKAEKFSPAAPVSPSVGFIAIEAEGRGYRVAIEEALQKWKPFAPGYDIQIERYLPYAIVEKNKLVSRSKDPINPAVELNVRTSEGKVERHTLFANFPEFNTLHRPKTPDVKPLGIKIQMVSTAGQRDGGAGRRTGRLEFAVGSDGKTLYYRSFGMAGDLKGKGVVEPKKEIPTGWMDSKFRVAEWFPNAIQEDKPRYVDLITGTDGNFFASMHVRRIKGRDVASAAADPGRWVTEGAVETLPMNGENWIMQLSKEKLRLPFQIHLDRFTVHHDPGTTSAAGYESNVVVKDAAKNVNKAGRIWMNNPIDYGGYTFYQASYQMEEGRPVVSIFSVNYDPGRWVKYAGALTIVLGALTMFYMNPHYWAILLGRKRP